jgi:integrase
MRGSIKKRGRTWFWWADLPRTETGKRNRKSVGGFRTRRECEADLARTLAEIGKERDPFPEHTTFEKYAADWLEHKRADGRRPTTLLRYELLLRDDVLSVVGGVELRKIKPAHVRLVLDTMQKRGVAPRTVVQARAVFGGVMKQALADGLIETNPVSAVKRPKVERAKKVVPTPEQIKAVVEASKGTSMEIPILLGATTGARRSEVSGLRWSEIDLQTGRMRIVQGLQWLPTSSGRELSFTDPKSDKARRSVTLLPSVVERLRTHRKEQIERRLALGTEWDDSFGDLVCERGDGRPIDPDLFTKTFKRLAAGAGLDPRTRLHDLRHGVATQLARAGVHPHTVSSVMGHSSVAFTMDVYTEDWDEATEQAASALDRVLDL